MIAVDTNVLIYANRAELPLYAVARTRQAGLAEGAVPWGLPVVVAWGFVRIVTQPIFDPPTSIGQSGRVHRPAARQPTVRVLAPSSRHWNLLRTVLDEGQVRGGLVTGAVIVALCREHGVDTVLINDRDFERFPDI